MVDVFNTKNYAYIFMNYCSEGDLKNFIPKFNASKASVPSENNGSLEKMAASDNILEESDAKYVIREVVEGLNYLKQNNFMHRDIKLENILVNKKCQMQNSKGTKRRRPMQGVAVKESITNYEFKLGDMGLAKQLRSSTDLAQTFAGTPLTMAPEMIAGK